MLQALMWLAGLGVVSWAEGLSQEGLTNMELLTIICLLMLADRLAKIVGK